MQQPAVVYCLLVAVYAFLMMPVHALMGWLRHRNAGDTTTTLSLESALDVSQIGTTEVQWREVKRVVEWGSDVFIHSARKGILVPREAFDSPLQRDVFVRRAKMLHGNARNNRTKK